jgi:vancomycin resistance protein YoaR
MTVSRAGSRPVNPLRKPARIIALGALAALALLIVCDLALSYNRIHTGVRVAGQDVGRQTREEATARLQKLADLSAAQSITLEGEGQRWDVLPADVGTTMDIEKSVEAAFSVTRASNPLGDLRTRFSLYFSTRDVPLLGSLDKEALGQLMQTVAGSLDQKPQNAGVKIEGTEVQLVEGRAGRVVDQGALSAQLEQTIFSFHQTTLPIPMTAVEPDIKEAGTARAVDQAKAMLQSPVVLVSADSQWTLEPEQLASYLDFKVEGSGADAQLSAYVSHEKAEPLLAQVAETVDIKPQNATWETDGQTATLVPGVTGKVIHRVNTAADITTAALSATERTAQVQFQEREPDRTTADAEEMGVKTKLGGFTTEFGGSDNRRDNVQQAARLISGTLLAPGEEFDFDRVVGQRTADNGFKTAPAIVRGKLEDTLGGGICQVATTLFNAVFFAGLDVTARSNHSLYISHYPKGRDATVSWGGPAFRFRNDTDHYVLIKSASSRSSLTFVIYGTSDGREVSHTTGEWYGVQAPTEKRVQNAELTQGETRVIDEGQTGRSIKVVRKVTRDGSTLHEDNFVSKYPMIPRLIEEGTKPAPTTTTTVAAPSGPTTTKPPSTTTSTQ